MFGFGTSVSDLSVCQGYRLRVGGFGIATKRQEWLSYKLGDKTSHSS